MNFYDHIQPYFKKLPPIIWNIYYLRFNKRYPDSFAMTYDKNLKEQWWIERKLFEEN